MPWPEPGSDRRIESADQLLRQMAALEMSQRRWLADLCAACPAGGPSPGDPLPVLRRWQERLSSLSLHLLRSEHRLVQMWGARPSHPSPECRPSGPPQTGPWRDRIEPWLDLHPIPGTYLRLDSCLDPEGETVVCAIATDLSMLAALAEATRRDLIQIAGERPNAGLEERFFYQVLSPWRRMGRAPLRDVLRWLDEVLDEVGDW